MDSLFLLFHHLNCPLLVLAGNQGWEVGDARKTDLEMGGDSLSVSTLTHLGRDPLVFCSQIIIFLGVRGIGI